MKKILLSVAIFVATVSAANAKDIYYYGPSGAMEGHSSSFGGQTYFYNSSGAMVGHASSF